MATALIELLSVPIVDVKTGTASRYFEDAWYQLIQTLGGEGAASVDDTTNFTPVSVVFNSPVSDLYTHSVSANYTTIGNEFIEVTASCLITLNLAPKDKEVVTIYINGGTGSTLTDGTETDTFLLDGTVLTYRYYVDIDEWVRGG